MHLPTSGVEINLAYSTCIFLFGVLFLKVRSRRIGNGIPYPFYVSPSRAAIRPRQKNKSAQVSRGAAAPVLHSKPLSSAGLEHAVSEQDSPELPQSHVHPAVAPENFQTEPIPSEIIEPVEIAETPAFVLPANALTIPENVSISMAAESYEQFEERIEERSAQELATVMDSHGLDQSTSEGVIVAEGGETEHPEMQEAAIEPVVWPIAASSDAAIVTDVLSFYGLPQQPFDVTPDHSYLYFSPSHREALTSLKEGIEYFRGFMVLVAEPGMGKTTVLHKLMEELSDSARVVFLFQTQCNSRELLCFILNELEVDHTGMDVVAMHRALNQALLEEMLRGRRFVLVVDEAQNLQEPVLETIRLLSDFETTHSKLIQIILSGQPQLAETLMKPSLVQLRQRITVLSNLKSLSADQTAEYVEYRLRTSGWKGEHLFTAGALAQIAESSGGVPRTINNLCFNALLAAFHRGQEIIDAETIKAEAEKLNLEPLTQRPQPAADFRQASAKADAISTSELAHALAAALSADARTEGNSAPMIGPKSRPEVVLTGNLTEKVRSQGWSKRHEYRIMVTLERDPVTGAPIADRYYCCSIYVDAPQAAGLQTGKPVRIKIEQD